MYRAIDCPGVMREEPVLSTALGDTDHGYISGIVSPHCSERDLDEGVYL